jgi:hypothetical protein
MPRPTSKIAKAEPTGNPQAKAGYKRRSPAPNAPVPSRRSARNQKQILPAVSGELVLSFGAQTHIASEEPAPTDSLAAPAAAVPEIQDPDEFSDFHLVMMDSIPDEVDPQPGENNSNDSKLPVPSQRATPKIQISSTSANSGTQLRDPKPVPASSVRITPVLHKPNLKKPTGKGKKVTKTIDLDDEDESVYIEDDKTGENLSGQEDEDSNVSDPYTEAKEFGSSDLEEEPKRQTVRQKQAPQPGRKPGRPPKTSPPVPICTSSQSLIWGKTDSASSHHQLHDKGQWARQKILTQYYIRTCRPA